MQYLNRENVTKLLLILFMFCTIVFGLFSTIPMYETPTIDVISEDIPEYELSITNSTWLPSERILLANLTPQLEDPSWDSSEKLQREHDARIETSDGSSILYFNNYTAVNETYTWNDYAGWDLLWPFAVLNYTELTAEWHIRVLQGNITIDSYFRIGTGYSYEHIIGSSVTGSKSEMNASAGENITLVSSASNFTERFSYMEVGVLWVSLDIIVAPGSIVAIDNVEVWISTDEPLCSVTLDFQSLYGQSLFSDPSIISQWLGTAYRYSYSGIGEDLEFYMRSTSTSLPRGWSALIATRSNQTAYLAPGNYSLDFGWYDTYLNDEYTLNLVIHENTSLSMQIPLPFNRLSFEMSINQIPGLVRVTYGGIWTRVYFDAWNITESGEILMMLPQSSIIYLQLNIPRTYWEYEVALTDGAQSKIVIDMKMIPLFGICFSSQQIANILLASLFAVLSLIVLLYRWHGSKDASYLTLVPMVFFVISLILPWYTKMETYGNVEYTTYFSPILGNRLWYLDNLLLTAESVSSSEFLLKSLLTSMMLIYTIVFCVALMLFVAEPPELLFVCSIGILIGGIIPLFTIGALPWLGFWCMIGVPILAYIIRARSGKRMFEDMFVYPPTQQLD